MQITNLHSVFCLFLLSSNHRISPLHTLFPIALEGWTPDFVPSILDKSVADETVLVTEDEAISTAQQLAFKEGIFCGISSGGTFAAALKVAHNAPAGSVLLAMLPDTGERYLSTPLFANVNEGSDPEP